jgi:23S rRNA pseudouridine1911/1915/1917 synthase
MKQDIKTKAAQFEIQIVFEDDDLVVVNKPHGVVTNRAETVKGLTIQEWMEDRIEKDKKVMAQVKDKKFWQDLVPVDFDQQWGSVQEIFTQRGGMVHRLDKDTSGILVLAKNPGSLVNLLAQFKNRQVQKTYQCLVHGKFKVAEGVVAAPIARARKDRKKFAVGVEGRNAETHYQVKNEFSDQGIKEWLEEVKEKEIISKDSSKFFKKNLQTYNQGFSLLECLPKTGRTHQIRVHMAHLQHPLVGDKTYGGRKRIKLDSFWCPRHFLHAISLELAHPRSGKKIRFEAAILDDLKGVLAIFKN